MTIFLIMSSVVNSCHCITAVCLFLLNLKWVNKWIIWSLGCVPPLHKIPPKSACNFLSKLPNKNKQTNKEIQNAASFFRAGNTDHKLVLFSIRECENHFLGGRENRRNADSTGSDGETVTGIDEQNHLNWQHCRQSDIAHKRYSLANQRRDSTNLRRAWCCHLANVTNTIQQLYYDRFSNNGSGSRTTFATKICLVLGPFSIPL